METEAAKLIGAGIATLALLGVGLGLGNLFSNLLAAIGRNPSMKDELFNKAMIGFALTESIALMAFIVAMMILNK